MSEARAVHRVGILGCGNVFPRYGVGLKRYPELQVVRAGDIDVERAKEAADRYGYPAFGDDADLYADDSVEIIVDLTPPSMHATTVIRALAAGKHVYVEKPLATTVEDGRRILEASSDAQRIVGSAPDIFLGNAGQTARRAVDDGLIGEPIGAAAFIRHGKVEGWHPDPRFLFRPGGGPVMDMGPYYFSSLVNCLGPITTVAASGRTGARQRKMTAPDRVVDVIDVEVATHFSAVFNFASGAIGTLMASFDVWDTALPWLEIYGTEGTLSLPDPDVVDGDVRVRRHEDAEWRLLPPVISPLVTDDKLLQYRRGFGVRDVANGIEGRPHRANGVFAFHVLEVLCGIASAAQEIGVTSITSTCTRPEPVDLTVDHP
jgi:predicted dehydrogenase